MSTDDDAWAVSFAAFVVVIVAILLATLRWADKIDGAGPGVMWEHGADAVDLTTSALYRAFADCSDLTNAPDISKNRQNRKSRKDRRATR